MLQLLFIENADLFKLRVCSIEFAVFATSAELIVVLRNLRLTLDSLDLCNVGLGLLLLLFEALEMKGAMVQTLVESLIALLMPALNQACSS